jgi:hypothetical protein
MTGTVLGIGLPLPEEQPAATIAIAILMPMLPVHNLAALCFIVEILMRTP